MFIHTAQSSPTLLPQESQSVCPGGILSYTCTSNGDGMILFSPPIINESNPLPILSSDPALTCRARVMSNLAATVVLVEFSSLIVTFTLYIPNEQSAGQHMVFCRVSSANGTETTTSTFSVLGKHIYMYM